jgi:tetratricopeptide (TPR) repeat protein
MRLLSILFALFVVAGAFAQGPATPAAKKELEKLAKLEKEYTAAKRSFDRTPKNSQLRQTYIQATMRFGLETMNSPALPPREKYPKAIRLFREVRKVDPQHKQAREMEEMIESIYKRMGRPVPK